MTLVQLNPSRNLVSRPKEIDRFFNNFNLNLEESDTVWTPRVDVSENEKEYTIVAELPGLKKEDIHVNVENGYLKILGEKKSEEKTEGKNYHQIERKYGKFERSFRLPKLVKSGEIKAKYENGVLMLSIPKSEQTVAKQIEIN